MRVQIVLSSFGFWGEKLVAPMEEFDAARITYQFATPWGHPPAVVDVSMDPTYIDPPLNAPATTPGDGRQGAGGCGLHLLSTVRAVTDVSIDDFKDVAARRRKRSDHGHDQLPPAA